VLPLHAGDYYYNAFRPSPFECNVPIYALYSACGDCQSQYFLPWTAWTVNCTSTAKTYQGLTLPDNMEIPSWANLDVTVSLARGSVMDS
jgi:hypothetical protein